MGEELAIEKQGNGNCRKKKGKRGQKREERRGRGRGRGRGEEREERRGERLHDYCQETKYLVEVSTVVLTLQ